MRGLDPEVARRVPPNQRLVTTWPVLHLGGIPRFDEATWTFEVSGLVERPFVLSYAELKALGPVGLRADFHCVTGWSALDLDWTGVPVRVLAERAGLLPEARFVVAHCDGDYTTNLSLEAVMDDDVLVAWAEGGADLTPDHGFPLRLVVPKRYGWKSAKWLRALEFTDRNRRGFWEVRGYHVHADPFREERYAHDEGPDADLEP